MNESGHSRNFSEIMGIKDLADFLKEQSRTHRYLFHFTNLKSLLGIVSSRTWRLSSLASMNDQHEPLKISCSMENIYTASFSFGDDDNFAMWERYGNPPESAVMIAIPIGNFDKLCDENTYLSDIVYFQGYTSDPPPDCLQVGKKLLWAKSEITEFDSWFNDACPDPLAGIIKNSAWKHEDETRLIRKGWDGRHEISLPDGFFSGWIVRLGPFFSVMDCEFVRQKLSEFSNHSICVGHSYFSGVKQTKVFYKPRNRTCAEECDQRICC